jgi:hypothetical protein
MRLVAGSPPRQAGFVPRSCKICGGQNDTGAGFLLVFRFPLPILIPLTAPQSSSIIRGWYNKPNIGGRTKWTQSVTPPQENNKGTCIYTEREGQRDRLINGNMETPYLIKGSWKRVNPLTFRYRFSLRLECYPIQNKEKIIINGKVKIKHQPAHEIHTLQ